MPKKRTGGRWFLRGFGCGVVLLPLLVGAMIFYMRHEAKRITFTRLDVPSSEWTLSPLKVAVVADFHVPPTPDAVERLGKIVDAVNAEKPDLILLPGDFAAGVRLDQTAPPETIAGELSRLKAPLGVYAVLGNHESWIGKEGFLRAFAAKGIPLLEDRSVVLEFNGKRFLLAGASDAWTRTPEAWEALLPKDSLPRIVMTHTPDIFSTMPEPVALAVAGHTHGGQIVLPLYGPVVMSSRLGRRYAYGLVREGRNTVFVTRGTGTSIVPLRLLCPPEIAVLTLKGKAPAVPEPVVPAR